MCNEIKCAVQENVQIGCTGNVHIAAVWMMGNNGAAKTCCQDGDGRLRPLWASKMLFRNLWVTSQTLRPCFYTSMYMMHHILNIESSTYSENSNSAEVEP